MRGCLKLEAALSSTGRTATVQAGTFQGLRKLACSRPAAVEEGRPECSVSKHSNDPPLGQLVQSLGSPKLGSQQASCLGCQLAEVVACAATCPLGCRSRRGLFVSVGPWWGRAHLRGAAWGWCKCAAAQGGNLKAAQRPACSGSDQSAVEHVAAVQGFIDKHIIRKGDEKGEQGAAEGGGNSAGRSSAPSLHGALVMYDVPVHRVPIVFFGCWDP